jgi:hypothetical protein
VLRLLAWLAAFALLTVCFTWFAHSVVPRDKLCPDYVCFWTAGKLLLAGQSPYSVELQTQVQHAYGWDRVKNGLGEFDFLPFYYPPWLAFLCAPLVPLGYHRAQVAWFVLNADFILLAGYLLRGAIPGVPRTVALLGVPAFVFSIVTVFLGQSSPLIFFLLVVAWRLLESRNDRAGGAVLAWLTIKPQVTVLVLFAVPLWAARQRRWGVVVGFVVMLAILALASSLLIPGWTLQMIDLFRQVPVPTAHFPWIGTTWFLLLRTAGWQSGGFWALYALMAMPLGWALLRAATDRSRPLRDVIGLGLIAACILAPYGRHYDFPLLFVPLLVLLGTRLPEAAGAALLVALLLLPYLQYLAMGKLGLIGQTGHPSPEFLFAWVPLLLGATWLASARRRAKARPAGRPSRIPVKAP